MAASPAAPLERVNLNLPSPAREKLRLLAKTAGKPDAVYARELLLGAIESAEEAEFRKKLRASRTPLRERRDREIALALERLRG
jgi:predicted DNA-binding protein